jgi:acyl-CoA thioesterase FadM
MIKLFGRMIPAAVRGLARPTVPAGQIIATPFRVLPHDIDLNMHLNNGRYMQIMDVNRMEFMLRTGVAQVVLKQRWKPILGSIAIQFRRELRLWERAIASTRLAGWNGRWVYLEHRIDTPDGRPVAMALAKAAFRKNGGWVHPEALRDALLLPLSPMPLPAHVLAWQGLDDLLGQQLGNPAPNPPHARGLCHGSIVAPLSRQAPARADLSPLGYARGRG